MTVSKGGEMNLLKKYLNTDKKRIVFACVLQVTMGAAMLLVPAFWLTQSTLAILLGLAGFIASTVATGWYLAGIIADVVNLESVLLMMMLVCVLDIAVGMAAMGVLIVISLITWAMVV